jgi:hypothetical protein
LRARKKIGFILIGIAAAVGILFLIGYIQFQNAMYRIDNFDKLWNESLSDLRSGKITVLEYCDRPVHDDQICTDYKNLHGIK